MIFESEIARHRFWLWANVLLTIVSIAAFITIMVTSSLLSAINSIWFLLIWIGVYLIIEHRMNIELMRYALQLEKFYKLIQLEEKYEHR